MDSPTTTIMNSWDAAAQRRASQIQQTQDNTSPPPSPTVDAIELENLRQRDETIQKEQERKSGCFGYFQRIWNSITAEKKASELDSLELYYLFHGLVTRDICRGLSARGGKKKSFK